MQLPANSPAAVVAGFAPLKPEQSDNYSIGLVLHPIEKLQITVDAYEIDIRDRIISSGFLLGSVLNPATGGQTVVSQAVLSAISAHGNVLDSGISYAGIQLFTNGVNTKTQGVELTANYSSDFSHWGHVDWSLGVNYNETTITKEFALPKAGINTAFSQTELLNPFAITALTTAVPKVKVILGAYWTLNRWSVNLREEVHGPSSDLVSLAGTGSGPGTSRADRRHRHHRSGCRLQGHPKPQARCRGQQPVRYPAGHGAQCAGSDRDIGPPAPREPEGFSLADRDFFGPPLLASVARSAVLWRWDTVQGFSRQAMGRDG